MHQKSRKLQSSGVTRLGCLQKGSIAPLNGGSLSEKVTPIFTKFEYVIAHALIPGLNIFEIFSANRKSAILDFLRDFKIYEHMFEYFRMHKKL